MKTAVEGDSQVGSQRFTRGFGVELDVEIAIGCLDREFGMIAGRRLAPPESRELFRVVTDEVSSTLGAAHPRPKIPPRLVAEDLFAERGKTGVVFFEAVPSANVVV